MKKTAIFPGTFDPFTVGHASLIKRSLRLFDNIIIALGINDAKQTYFRLEDRIEMISSFYNKNPHISVLPYSGLTVDFAKEMNAEFIIRGIRSINDFEYEKAIADINRKISGIDTFILFTDPEYTHISSTIVRELLRFGHDITDFIPEGMKLP